jgi:hypothetical protein
MLTPVQRSVAYSLLNEFKATGTVEGASARPDNVDAGLEITRSVEQFTQSAGRDNTASDLLLVPGTYRDAANSGASTFVFRGDPVNGELQESSAVADRETQWYTRFTPSTVDRAVVFPAVDAATGATIGLTMEFAHLDRLNLTGQAFTRTLTNAEIDQLATQTPIEPILLP